MGSQIGLFSGRKVFSSQYITAEITDASNNLWFVPIKFVFGDFFLTKINSQVHVFKLDGTRIKTSKAGGAKSFSVMHYDVSHYLPISHADIKAMEIILSINSLPKINSRLLGILKILGKTEKEGNFKEHNLDELIERLQSHPKRFEQEISELINFMASLDTAKIVTPVKRMVDFIEGDLKTIDSQFLGTIYTQAQRVDEKAKKILNPVLTAKKSWLVLILALACVGLVIALLYVAYDAGYFDGAGSIIPSIGGGTDYSEKSLMTKYPNAGALRAGVDSGALNYDKLPKSVQKIVDDTPSPIAVETP
jgi:hypothetical protein